MTKHDEYMKRLSPERRAKIKARAQELIAEEMTLSALRKAKRLSQETLAELLQMRKGDLSKFERSADAYLSTIRRYVVAMGGSLDLIDSFPNSKPVKIIHIGDLDEESDINEERELA
ncbi:MAG: XRE family transcriptional regulator [Candidatus Melainabacteria bacterium]|nr:XRE family transcriptional regulator [Candidatus Melainabacteria bacterium]